MEKFIERRYKYNVRPKLKNVTDGASVDFEIEYQKNCRNYANDRKLSILIRFRNQLIRFEIRKWTSFFENLDKFLISRFFTKSNELGKERYNTIYIASVQVPQFILNSNSMIYTGPNSSTL